MMKALVTGANGFIGSCLAKALLAQGHKVRGLVHKSDFRVSGTSIEIVRGSVENRQILEKAVQGIDTVFHLAARATDWGTKDQFYRTNTLGTQYLLDACRSAEVGKFVYMSSLAVHQFHGYVNADESVPADQKRYHYGASKVAAEQLVNQAFRSGALEAIIIRPGAVIFGPEDTTAFVFMAPMLQKGQWTHVRGGRTLICYSYVENLVDGLLLAAESPRAVGQTLIITDDLRLDWKTLISSVIAQFGARERSFSFPAPIARTAGIGLEWLWRLARSSSPPPITDYRTALVSKDFHFSCNKAKELLQYRPRVGFEDGLAKTVAWYRSRNGSA